MDRLIKATEKTQAAIGTQENLLVALARRYHEGNPEDFDSALSGLQHALEQAAEMRDQLPGSASDASTLVEAQVKKLNDAGDVDAAEEALWDELERAQAAQLRLVEAGLRQVVLTRNVDRAVALELKKLSLQSGGFEALRDVMRGWYERGRDKGLRFDLEVAIGLAQQTQKAANTKDQRGTALNDLGIALATLGERDTGTKRLQEAVTAYRDALRERAQERVPLDWAKTQNNLGAALQTLGQRETGTQRLEEAVTAYRDALRERIRERAPLDWAMTQNNLGNALWTLGKRETGTDRLEQAVEAYRDALLEYTRDCVPLDWAMTQNNLGTALLTLGERETGTTRLEEAATAYQYALRELLRERVPLDWAMTQHNLAGVEIAFFDKTGKADALDRAQDHAEQALDVFEETQASYFVEETKKRLSAIQSRRR
ncbi:tetratricopeptide repeat protein [Shimia sp.]|uniref:tetratricopeptide repeat protein n=1 Tax=Shimia sp. TaxID=1954381 RepID=UPI0032986267